LALTNATNALETLNLKSSGSAANTVTLTETAGGAEPTTYAISGDQNLTITTALANFDGETVTNTSTGTVTLKNNTALARSNSGFDQSCRGCEV